MELFWNLYNYAFTFNEYIFYKANIIVESKFYSQKFDTICKLNNTKSETEIHLLIKLLEPKSFAKLRLKCRKDFNEWNIQVTQDLGFKIHPILFCITDDNCLKYASKHDFYCKHQIIYEL
jgi:hypothetical protein